MQNERLRLLVNSCKKNRVGCLSGVCGPQNGCLRPKCRLETGVGLPRTTRHEKHLQSPDHQHKRPRQRLHGSAPATMRTAMLASTGFSWPCSTTCWGMSLRSVYWHLLKRRDEGTRAMEGSNHERGRASSTQEGPARRQPRTRTRVHEPLTLRDLTTWCLRGPVAHTLNKVKGRNREQTWPVHR